jgi:UDP-GlcNAc:undecaprenyl-phosphate GlcNAc-1-phosphate transferase
MTSAGLLASASLSAALVSCAFAYLLVGWSVPLRLVARPRADRWHARPTPNTGGIAILVSSALCYALFAAPEYRVIAAGAAFVSLLGFIDDRVRLRPAVKFAGQSIAALLVISNGVVLRASPWEPANLVLSFLWIAGITNAFNLIDNMDGLCGGVAAIICGSRFVLAIEDGDRPEAVMLAILGGAALGFLVFNYNPARIFLGDCGSMFLGFSLAALAIAAPVPSTRVFASTLFYPVIAFLYPIFDTALVSILRRSAGRPISVGGRDHSSHRLVALGLSERRAVWMLWLLSAAGAAGGMLTYAFPLVVLVIAVVLTAGVSVFGIFLGTLPAFAPPESAPIRSPWIRKRIPSLRAAVTLIVDTLFAGVALLAAFLIRWDNILVDPQLRQFLVSLPLIMGSHSLASTAFRTFDSGWRFFSIRDLFALGCSTLAGAAATVFALWFLEIEYSRGVVVLYALLVLAFTAGVRLSMRLLWHSLNRPTSTRRAAVLAAGGLTDVAVLVLQRYGLMNATPVAVLDPDPAAHHLRVHGVKVHYAGEHTSQLLTRLRADLLVVPGGAALSGEHRAIVDQCSRAGVPIEQLDLGMTSWITPAGPPKEAHAAAG